MEEESFALSSTIFSEHWPKHTKVLVVHLSPSSFLWPLIISHYAVMRYMPFRIIPNICVMPFRIMPFCVIPFCVMPFSRHAYLRYAFSRHAYLRYAFSRYAFLRYAFSRYVFSCYAFSRYAFYHSVCLSAFWLAAWYLKRVFALQLWLDAFPIWNIESACCYSALDWCMYNLDNLISIPGYWILS